MRYLSVCSGIEAATVAWHPLGWKPVAFSEIEPFPCKVLAHHYPNTPNLGDMTKFKEWPDAQIDLLVGGTPCQSFSVAGLRKGLDDPRGNLMLTYLAIADKYKPKWIVWENVPGVLSSNGGRDFGTFLGAMEKLGYGFAYRVLDAQYVRTDGYPYAVPQRRRRVFVVGCLGDWGRAAAVLFDSESLLGNTPPRREAWKTVAGTIGSRTTGGGGLGTDFDLAGGLQPVAFDTTQITSKANGSNPQPGDPCHPLARGAHAPAICMSTGQAGAEIGIGIGTTLNCNHEAPIAFTARDYGNDATDSGATPTMRSLCCGADGHQSGAAGLAVAYRTNAAGQVDAQDGIAAALNTQTDPCAAQIVAFTQNTVGHNPHNIGGHRAVAIDCYNGSIDGDTTLTLRKGNGNENGGVPAAMLGMQVRRLMPIECERLQGFPDNHTNIPGASDTTRYKALGNSMAVNVMQLIGQRIQYVESVL